MTKSRSARRALLAVTAGSLLPVLLFATACGSSGGDGGSAGSAASGGASGSAPSVTKDASAAGLVPASFRSAGVLRVASDATYPPLESIGSDGKTVVGMDADIAAGIGQVLGLKVQVMNASFDTIIPSLQAKKFDLGISGFNDTVERQKTVDFVDYYKGGSSFFVKANGPTVNSLADLCGKKVAVEKGTTQLDDATAQNAKCKSAGQPAATLLVYPDQNGANLALSSGRADVSIADSPVAAFQVKQSNGQFKLSDQEYGVVLHGIAIDKGNGLAPAIQAAIKSLIDQGAYAKITAKWGIADSDTVSAPTINGATS
jgi:polar amino acid transport system substrate-binding protein